MKEQQYHIHQGDCIPHLHELAEQGRSFPLSIFSPPFATLFSYSQDSADMGNSRDSDDEFLLHYSFFAHALARVMQPGSLTCVHLQQVVRRKSQHGHMGLFDIRGHVNRLMEDAGFYLYGETTIRKDPQAQSIRTKAHQLQFTQWEKDSSVSRPALCDYLQIFKMPGERSAPVRPLNNGLIRDTWIEWAEGIWQTTDDGIVIPASCWFDIRETHVLNNRASVDEVIGAGHKVSETKFRADERHMCPLQLDLVDRCVLLWSNEGEEILTPFSGIGSELVMPLLRNRKAYGIELNPNYVREAHRNCEGALAKVSYQKNVLTLF
jgi:DNA methylase